jgi:hypothetical protein
MLFVLTVKAKRWEGQVRHGKIISIGQYPDFGLGPFSVNWPQKGAPRAEDTKKIVF